MASFVRLIRFESAKGSEVFFAEVGLNDSGAELQGQEVQAFSSFEDLLAKSNSQSVQIGRLLAPLPNPEIPIYCVGLNYKSHATEAKLNIPKYPPLWTKPKASLANPAENIPINKFCAVNALDYEGEVVFVTSKECRDLSPEEAESYILGYTVGNDLSCRTFQFPAACGGQYYFAKAFDKFAPIGPTLLSASEFDKLGGAVTLITKVNGEEVQKAQYPEDLIFKPAEILSHMSQGTTIPAYTAVMTGTPAGVGVFRNGGTFLKHGDVIEVELGGVGMLSNKMAFE